MAKTIAITGKGGTGKTAVSSMVVRARIDAGGKPVLAVDGDPNANFHATLGVDVDITIGGIRESEIEERQLLPPGMSKPEYFEYRTRQALVESTGFDFLSIGRPEGPGCYCFANSMLRAALGKIEGGYSWIVVDCEAGLEHFSRRTAGAIDLLVILSDPSRRGMQTARNVISLADSLETHLGEVVVAVNRCPDPIPEAMAKAAEDLDLTINACLPEDAEVGRRDLYGDPLLTIPDDSPLLGAVRSLLGATRVVGASLPNLAPAS